MLQEYIKTAAEFADNDKLVSQIKTEKITSYRNVRRKRSILKDLVQLEHRKTVVTIVVIQFALIFMLTFVAHHLTRYGTDLFTTRVDEVWALISNKVGK